VKRDLTFEFAYPYPVEEVWWALTDAATLSEWLMPNDIRPVVGHRFQFRTKPAPGFDGIVHCEVLRADAPSVLSYTWRGGGVDTVVTFTLTPTPAGTHVHLEHTGFDGLRATFVSFILGSGWRSAHTREKLTEVLERRRVASLGGDGRGGTGYGRPESPR
jgi:uncharacterized protein YndB with AHSA1/START domain